MSKGRKFGLLISVLTISMFLNIENTISIFLADMAAAFPEYSNATIQQIASSIFLVELFAQLTCGFFARRMSKKTMIIVFQSVTVLGGLLAYIAGSTIVMLYAASFIIGVGAAIISNVNRTVIPEIYNEKERPWIYSAQQIAMSLGSILLNLITGWLVVLLGWRAGYLAFCFGFISIITAALFMKHGEKEVPPAKKEKTDRSTLSRVFGIGLVHHMIIGLLFVCMFMAFNYNIGFLVQEKQFGNAAVVGYISSILMGAKLVSALVMPFTRKILGKWVFAICSAVAALSFIIMGTATNVWILILGVIILGFSQDAFTLIITVKILDDADPTVITTTMAAFNIAVSLASYIAPYVVTVPCSWLGGGAVTTFWYAAVVLVLLAIGETIYLVVKKNKNAKSEAVA